MEECHKIRHGECGVRGNGGEEVGAEPCSPGAGKPGNTLSEVDTKKLLQQLNFAVNLNCAPKQVNYLKKKKRMKKELSTQQKVK